MCVQLAPPRPGQLVDHLRPVEPRRSNGNRLQPLTLANAGFWERVADTVSSEPSARSIALSDSDFLPLSLLEPWAPRASLVQRDIDRINKKNSVDNFPPVGDGGSPLARANLTPVIKTHSDNIPGCLMKKTVFFCFGEVFGCTGWFQRRFERYSGRRRGRGPWDRWKRRTRQEQHGGKGADLAA